MKCAIHSLLSLAVSALLTCPVAFAGSDDGSPTGKAQGHRSDFSREVRNLRSDLESRGFKVAEGSFKLFTIEDCRYAIASLGNCVGNNPTAPYIFPSVPLWPDEFVDERMREAFGPLPNDTWATHRLDPREALVIMGRLPPPGAYFGIQTYVFSREGSINYSDPVYLSLTDQIMRNILFALSPNPARVLVFSSIGNSTNNVIIKRQSGAAFDQQRFFIITPDAVMQREITDALMRTGLAHLDQVFTEPVAPGLVHVGLDEHADDFMTLIRYAEPKAEAAGDAWRHHIPLMALRVRDMNTARGTEPFQTPAYDAKIGRSELWLQGDLTNLIQAIKRHWHQAAAPVGPFQSLQLAVDLVGQHCYGRPMNCLADTQDTDYQVSPSVTIDSGEILAVVGTLATATRTATYVSLSVNRVAVLMGVANISGADLEGSASTFSGAADNTDRFYVHYFARDCTGLPDCSPLTEDLVPRGETIKIIQRNYIVPGTARGAHPRQVLNPSIIVFKGAVRPPLIR